MAGSEWLSGFKPAEPATHINLNFSLFKNEVVQYFAVPAPSTQHEARIQSLNLINMNKQTIKRSTQRLRVWALAFIGIALSGCSSNPPPPHEIENQPVRLEIHDSRGLLTIAPLIGETLTAVPVCPSGTCSTELDYQWYVTNSHGAEAILGATSKTYTPSAADVANRLFVKLRPK